MTQPDQQQVQITANAAVMRCPDGRHRISLQLAGPLTFGLLLDAEGADQFADQLAALIRDAARQCNLANGGLVVPTAGPLPADLNMLGNGVRRRP